MIDRRPIDSLYQNVYFEPGFVTDKRTRTIRSCEGDKRPPETMANGRSPTRKSSRSANGLTRSDSGRNRNRFDNYGTANVCRNRIMDSGNESEIDLMIFDWIIARSLHNGGFDPSVEVGYLKIFVWRYCHFEKGIFANLYVNFERVVIFRKKSGAIFAEHLWVLIKKSSRFKTWYY